MGNSKNDRLDAIKILISCSEIGSQDELLQALRKEGYSLTQATLSRDLKQLKVAKAASVSGSYVYVLPNNTMYKRNSETVNVSEAMQQRAYGFISINFSRNIAVIKTRPGFASSLAYDIDNSNLVEIIGTIAGDDTILMVMKEGMTSVDIVRALKSIIPNLETDKKKDNAAANDKDAGNQAKADVSKKKKK